MKKNSEGADSPEAGLQGGASASAGSSMAPDKGPSKKELTDGLQLALQSGDDGAVERSVANLLSQDNGDSKTLNSLGLYHLSKGRVPLAKMIFKSILDKDPKNSAALNNLGVILSQQGERRQAADHFRRALSSNPNYVIAAANLGCLYVGGRDYNKARAYLEIAYKGGIKDIALLNNYATVLLADNDGRVEGVLKEALDVNRDDLTVIFNYALYLTYIKRDFKEAGEMIDKIRFAGIPPQKKSAILRMEETINGHNSVETKAP